MTRLIAVVAALLGVAASCATPAAADPVTNYTNNFGPVACLIIGVQPNFTTITRIGDALHLDGLTYPEAGRVIRQSVTAYCPWHTPLLDLYAQAGKARTV
ncbi:hypothetical protein E3G52_000287 [Mycobacteroides abscessus]|uniref:hypothetical protein n=1 Tax=Mycobacteroides abscessus TaxID=36809 RepID=UPI001878E210|nr:hypothetical protein [Mycobacteroides abscessus]MBE5453423.1 hypothetical protein [Mycobacteroides abscessus]